jgi:hypothetical protein
VAVTTSALGAVARALIAWFMLAEVAFAYSRSAPSLALRGIILAPRQNSYIVGVALLFCAVVMLWVVLLVARA